MVFQVEQIAQCDLEWDIYSTSFDNRTMACARYLQKHRIAAKFEERISRALDRIARYSFVSCARTIDDYLASVG